MSAMSGCLGCWGFSAAGTVAGNATLTGSGAGSGTGIGFRGSRPTWVAMTTLHSKQLGHFEYFTPQSYLYKTKTKSYLSAQANLHWNDEIMKEITLFSQCIGLNKQSKWRRAWWRGKRFCGMPLKKNWWSEKGSGYLGTWNLGLGARGLDVDEGLACSMRNGPGQSLDHRQSVCQCRRVT